jgi:transcriptional regulator with XRE-family HTH domain
MFDRALKVVRQYHRLSQSDLADRLGISRSYLNEIEKGKKEPSIEILRRYSDLFGVPLSSLMLFIEEATDTPRHKVTMFAADKVLKMLEWLAEDIDEGNGKRESSKERKNSIEPVPLVPAPVAARTSHSSRHVARKTGEARGSKQVRRIHA